MFYHFKLPKFFSAGASSPTTCVSSIDSTDTSKIFLVALATDELASPAGKSHLNSSTLTPPQVGLCDSQDTIKAIPLSKQASQETLKSFEASDSDTSSSSSSDLSSEDIDDFDCDYPVPRGPYEYDAIFGASLYPPTPPLDTPFHASYIDGSRSTLNLELPASLPLSLPSPSASLPRRPYEYTNGEVIFLHDATPLTPAIHIHPPSSRAVRFQLLAVLSDIRGNWEDSLPDVWMESSAPFEDRSLLTAHRLRRSYRYPNPRAEKKKRVRFADEPTVVTFVRSDEEYSDSDDEDDDEDDAELDTEVEEDSTEDDKVEALSALRWMLTRTLSSSNLPKKALPTKWTPKSKVQGAVLSKRVAHGTGISF